MRSTKAKTDGCKDNPIACRYSFKWVEGLAIHCSVLPLLVYKVMIQFSLCVISMGECASFRGLLLKFGGELYKIIFLHESFEKDPIYVRGRVIYICVYVIGTDLNIHIPSKNKEVIIWDQSEKRREALIEMRHLFFAVRVCWEIAGYDGRYSVAVEASYEESELYFFDCLERFMAQWTE